MVSKWLSATLQHWSPLCRVHRGFRRRTILKSNRSKLLQGLLPADTESLFRPLARGSSCCGTDKSIGNRNLLAAREDAKPRKEQSKKFPERRTTCSVRDAALCFASRLKELDVRGGNCIPGVRAEVVLRDLGVAAATMDPRTPTPISAGGLDCGVPVP